MSIISFQPQQHFDKQQTTDSNNSQHLHSKDKIAAEGLISSQKENIGENSNEDKD